MIKSFLQKWLGIQHSSTEYDDKPLIEIIENVRQEFKQHLGKITTHNCAECGKIIIAYPFGEGYYKERDGKMLCSGACLDKYSKKRVDSILDSDVLRDRIVETDDLSDMWPEQPPAIIKGYDRPEQTNS